MMLRSPTVIIASVGLWGMNVYFFRLFHIDYAYVLNLDLYKEREAKLRAAADVERNTTSTSDNTPIVAADTSKISQKTSEADEDDDYQEAVLGEDDDYGRAVTWQKLIGLSVALMVLLHLSIFAWMDLLGGGSIGAVFMFYIAVFIGVVLPLPSTRWLRTSCVVVLQRAFELLNPRCFCVNSSEYANGPRPIPFIDVFFADAMCSLSKVFFDWGMLFHLASHYPEPVPKSTHSILIPSFCAAIPYIIRARQCLIMYTVGRIKVCICECFSV